MSVMRARICLLFHNLYASGIKLWPRGDVIQGSLRDAHRVGSKACRTGKKIMSSWPSTIEAQKSLEIVI